MPNYSAVDICNLALAQVGAAPIRSFTENNKRARMCNIFYPMIRDYLLSRYDWPFARKMVPLQALSELPTRIGQNVSIKGEIPEGWYAYKLPNDCIRPLELHPPGSREKWDQFQDMFLCKKAPEEEPKLYYTSQVTNTTQFSMTFVELLALGIAVKLAQPIAQDKQLTQTLFNQWQTEQTQLYGTDANVGEDYRHSDEMPDLDTFVNPDVRYINADAMPAK